MKILSIVADKPQGNGGGVQPSDLSAVSNLAIDDIVGKLKSAALGSVVRAAGLFDVQAILRNGDPGDVIQIVGHAAPGLLALGYYWSRIYESAEVGCHVLDSNPYAYYPLWHVMEQHKEPVLLVGCKVGSSEPSGMVATGRTLILDLEEMWGRRVYAAVDYVVPSDFVGGVFSGPLVDHDGKRAFVEDIVSVADEVKQALQKARDDKAKGGSASGAPVLLPVRAVCGAPILGQRYHERRWELDPDEAAAFGAVLYREVSYVPLLALPELVVEVSLPGRDGTFYANVFGGGEFLEAKADDGLHLYQRVCAENSLQGALRKVIATLSLTRNRDFAAKASRGPCERLAATVRDGK